MQILDSCQLEQHQILGQNYMNDKAFEKINIKIVISI